MLFPTFTFAAFFAVVLPVSWALKRWPVPWKIFVLAASYWFYAAWDRRFVLLLVAMTLASAASVQITTRYSSRSRAAKTDFSGSRFGHADFSKGQLSHADSPEGRFGRADLSEGRFSHNRMVCRAALVFGVAFNLGVLAFFKYYNFFAANLERNLGLSGPALNIILPVGVSFFTFQAISYVVDAYRGDTKAAGLLDVAVYLAFFPQLVAGPIVRATEFLPQIRFGSRNSSVSSQMELDRVDLGQAALLIGRGMFKKVVVADFLAQAIVDDTFGAPDAYGALDVIFGIYGYAVQIYADFSGYTDMAIGVALLMGFRFPQNFDRPYAAVSVQDFWRCWHMTLSRWLRDYLYIPLGGNRKGRTRTYIHLLVTMALGGLWHGAAGVFIVWGLYHGLGLAIERMTLEIRSNRAATRSLGASDNSGAAGYSGKSALTDDSHGFTAVGLWQRFWVFHFVCGGWVLFNSSDLGRALEVLERLIMGWGTGITLLNPLVAAVILGGVAAQYLPTSWTQRWSQQLSAVPAGWTAFAFAIWVMIVVAFGPEGVADYIYFQF